MYKKECIHTYGAGKEPMGCQECRKENNSTFSQNTINILRTKNYEVIHCVYKRYDS